LQGFAQPDARPAAAQPRMAAHMPCQKARPVAPCFFGRQPAGLWAFIQ